MSARAHRRSIAIWTLLVALIVVIVVVQRKDASAPQLVAAEIHWLLPAPIDELGAIEVANAGAVHRFERDESGAWFYHGAHTGHEGTHTHLADPASAQRIRQALAGFGRTRIERTFALHATTGDVPASTYGVAVPSVVVLVYALGGTRPWMQYAVGDVAPDGYSRYVLPVGSTMVVTIANYQITNLLNLIGEVGKRGE